MQKKYELLYVLDGTQTDEALNAQMVRVQAVVEAEAEIEEVFVWGRRKLAYEIQDLRDGFYVIIHFHAEPEQPQKIERLLRIYDDVLRYLITVSDSDFMPSVKQLSDAEIDDMSVEDPEEMVEQMVVESTVDTDEEETDDQEAAEVSAEEVTENDDEETAASVEEEQDSEEEAPEQEHEEQISEERTAE